MPKLEVDGAVLVYDDEGPRDGDGGVPLVFIHGWTANRHRWDDQFAHFAVGRRVIRLDLRGHGESTGAGARTVGELAADVVALLDHLEVDRFVPVGHSMGGMIAQTLVLDHPERVERMVLVDSISRMAYSWARGLLLAVSTLLPFKLFRRRQHPARLRPRLPQGEDPRVHRGLRRHTPRGRHDLLRRDAGLRCAGPCRRDQRAHAHRPRLPRHPVAALPDAADGQRLPGRVRADRRRRARTARGGTGPTHRADRAVRVRADSLRGDLRPAVPTPRRTRRSPPAPGPARRSSRGCG
ncbi:alpha/beta fold hydrolase [Streptomyces sp. NPDC051572]|uniref:alpha/beta fold hydrolase n=1 Tax=Streptomyces sp. NPDC051572 TaxID=3155802 RepID=UPI00344B2FD2